MNRQVDSHLLQAWKKITDTNDPGNEKHLEKVDELGAGGTSEQAPTTLFGAVPYGEVTVTAEQMGRLKQGQQIALAVKRFLKAGNQTLAIKETNGKSFLLQDYAQEYLRHSSKTETTIHAILLGVTNCEGHGTAVFKIVQSLDLPASLHDNRVVDHSYVRLEPDVIIDAWSTIPTVCLVQDFLFNTERVVDEHRPGDEIPTDFNLYAILEAKEKLEERLGQDGVAKILFEEKRKQLDISSKTLDHEMLKQGVTNYFDIDPEQAGPSQAEKSRITQKLENVQRVVEKAILKEAERRCGMAAPTEVLPTVSQSIRITGAGTEEEIAAATKEAIDEATEQANEGAKKAAEDKAVKSAQRKVSLTATKDASYTGTSIVTKGGATVTATVTATARADVKRYVWIQPFTAIPMQYRVDDGEAAQFNHVPSGHADEIQKACAKPDITFTKTDERKAKLRKYLPSTLVGAMNALGRKVKEKANKVAGNLAPVTQAELQAAAEQVVINALSVLQVRRDTLGPEDATDSQTLVRQKAMLEAIDKRIDGVSEAVINATTAALMQELEYLHPELRERACDMVERWAYCATKRISDQAMDEVARVRNMTSSSDDESL